MQHVFTQILTGQGRQVKEEHTLFSRQTMLYIVFISLLTLGGGGCGSSSGGGSGSGFLISMVLLSSGCKHLNQQITSHNHMIQSYY